MRYVLIGNYGVGNLGDDALKQYFLERFPEVEWCVLSAHPQHGELVRLPAGIRSFLNFSWLKTLKAIKSADGVVFGGGSLFTDAESFFACFLWWWHVFICRFFRKKIHFAFQGVGPFKTKLGEWISRRALRSATSISVRDSASFERVKSWNLNTKVIQSFDPVYSLIKSKKEDDRTQNIFIVIPRNNSPVSFVNRAKEIGESKEWNHVQILSLQSDNSSEKKLCQEVQSALPNATVHPVESIGELVSYIQDASFVLSQRYHGALVALALGKEFEVLPQEEDDKLSQLVTFMGKEEECERLILEGVDALLDWLDAGKSVR